MSVRLCIGCLFICMYVCRCGSEDYPPPRNPVLRPKTWTFIYISKINISVFFIINIKKISSLVTARKRSLGQGNIFSSICPEFCSQEGGSASVHAGIPPPSPQSRHSPWDQAPHCWTMHPPGADTPKSKHPPPRSGCWEIRSTNGWYASYWKAILF